MDAIKILEKQFKVLADKTRLTILQKINQGQSCGCDLVSSLEVSQPTLSHHLKVLSQNNFIIGIKEGNKTLYTVNHELINNLSSELSTLLKNNLKC